MACIATTLPPTASSAPTRYRALACIALHRDDFAGDTIASGHLASRPYPASQRPRPRRPRQPRPSIAPLARTATTYGLRASKTCPAVGGLAVLETMASWVRKLLLSAVEKLKGPARRAFMAETVEALGKGGQRQAEQQLGWNRQTIRKGQHERRTGVECSEAFILRGAKPVEERLPNLRADIKAIVEPESATDPTFRTTQIYRRLTAKEVRQQLISKAGYTDSELPSEETIRIRLNVMGYQPRKVRKSKPVKKIKQTDGIFARIRLINEAADADEGVLRISMDTKAIVHIGPFSRRGTSRQKVDACDHDHGPEASLTPVGIFVPQYDDFSMFFVESKVTADCLVDRLQQWWDQNKQRFPGIHMIVLNQDNGPESNSRRTQFIKRMIDFSDTNQLNLRLAYYPPYHSKYNPVERCWGVLENYWNGSLLDSIPAALGFAGAMTWKGLHPFVQLVTQTYEKGVRLSRKAMNALEERLERLAELPKWFVDIRYQPAST